MQRRRRGQKGRRRLARQAGVAEHGTRAVEQLRIILHHELIVHVQYVDAGGDVAADGTEQPGR